MTEVNKAPRSLASVFGDGDDSADQGLYEAENEWDELRREERRLASEEGSRRREETVPIWLDRLRDGEVTFVEFVDFARAGEDGKYLARLPLLAVLDHCKSWKGATAEQALTRAGFGVDQRVSSLHKSASKVERFAALLRALPNREWPPVQPIPDKWPVLSKLQTLGETDREVLLAEPDGAEELAALIAGWRR